MLNLGTCTIWHARLNGLLWSHSVHIKRFALNIRRRCLGGGIEAPAVRVNMSV